MLYTMAFMCKPVCLGLAVFILFQHSLSASPSPILAVTAASIATGLSPSNSSLVAQLPGAINSTLFECNIFEGENDGDLIQATTTWILMNYNSVVTTLVYQSPFEGVFLIDGKLRPPGSGIARTFRNRILVVNFTEELDRTTLQCMSAVSETEEPGYFKLRVYSKYAIKI